MKKAIMTAFSFCLCLGFMQHVAAETKADKILKDIESAYAPDKRVTVWSVNAENEGKDVVLTGKTDNKAAHDALLSALDKEHITYNDRIEMLPAQELGDKTWGLVMISAACLRTQPKNSAELASQALMGTPVRILEEASGFYRIQTPDNYIGYMTESSIVTLSSSELEAWKTSRRYIVTSYQTSLYENPDGDAGRVVSDLVLGNILQYAGESDGYVQLMLPDGRKGFARTEEVMELSVWADQSFDYPLIERTARRMMGTPYLWGGTSTKMVDCSGFVKTSYFANGIILQRDASQQALTGKKIDWRNWRTEAHPGDLIFIGTKSGRVTHVAMYIGDGKFIHSSGRVKINSLDPSDPDYLDYTILSMSRIEGQIETKGVSTVKSHEWYF